MKSRAEYFRLRTKIGRLEASALVKLIILGHEPKLIKDGRFSTAAGCHNCDAWGCIEIESGIELCHGGIFDEKCGSIMIEEGTYESNAAPY